MKLLENPDKNIDTNNKKENVAVKKKVVEIKKSEDIPSKNESRNDITYTEEKEELKEVIEKNSVTIITEEQLQEIIKHAKSSPLPANDIESKENLTLSNNSKISQPNFLIDIMNTLDKYEFSDKSEDIYGGKVTSKEITSDKIIDNLEFGVGVAYKKNEYYNSQYEDANSDIWNHTPIYATGKYKISTSEENTKYLKLNLGYAIGEYEDNKEYLEKKNQSGIYYGIGGGIEYQDVSLDLIYQVNKDAYEKNNSSQDDSRITFSLDYKLNF